MSDDRTRVHNRAGAPPDRSRVGEAAHRGIEPHPVIPNIALHDVLGRGGMAVVWEGSDHGFTPPRKVAVKFMDGTLSADPEFRARFDREASIVAGFRCDNIVRVYSSGEAGSLKYIVMEHLPGGTLAQKLRNAPPDARKALDIARQLADALAYSHERNIVHRDFKPGNVLFTGDGKPVLSDFGVAKVTTAEQAGMTQHAAVIGAPRYMAPEQARAQEVITDRADVYSWGVTLFEMLTGRLPPPTPPADRFKAQLRGQPAEIRDLLYRCLSFDPTQRPSAAQCRDVLAAAPSGRARSAAAYRWLDDERVRHVLMYGAALVPLAVVATIGGYWLAGRSDAVSPPESPVTTARPAAASGTAAVSFVRNPPFATIYLDGSVLTGSEASLAPGAHRMVAVAPGFYGEARSIDVGARSSAPIAVALTRTTLPSATAVGAFYDALEANTISDAALATVDERAMHEALRIVQVARRGDSSAAEAAEARLRELDARGDDRAPVTLFLNEAIRRNDMTEAMLTSSLLASADRGDALANFFVAQAHLATGSTQSYCRRMQTAAAGGWEVAAFQLASDPRCAN